MAGKVTGLSGIVMQSNKLALYTHCHSHRSCCKFFKRIISLRNDVDAIKAISYFFNLSPKRQEHFQKLIKKNFLEVTRKKLLDICRTRWLEPINRVDFLLY